MKADCSTITLDQARSLDQDAQAARYWSRQEADLQGDPGCDSHWTRVRRRAARHCPRPIRGGPKGPQRLPDRCFQGCEFYPLLV